MTEQLFQITIPNVPANVKMALDALAEADKRSLSSYVRIVLEKHVRAMETFDSLDETKPLLLKSIAA